MGFVFMILWWALIAAAIAALIQWIMQQDKGKKREENSGLRILKERYARGEIEKKEFEEKKRELS